MKDEIEITRGSGNIFRDLGRGDADLNNCAPFAAKIIAVLDGRKLTVRRAGEITGIAAADFSRNRNANLDRFTVDRLMTILARLDQHVDVTVKVTARPTKHHPAASAPFAFA